VFRGEGGGSKKKKKASGVEGKPRQGAKKSIAKENDPWVARPPKTPKKGVSKKKEG